MASKPEPRLVLPSSRDAKFTPKREAFVFQVEALEAIKALEYSAVFHEQGLGKTKIGVDLLLYWLANDLLDSVIVVTKKGLIQNWKDEIAAHSYLEPRLLDQNRRSNFYAFNSPARLYLTNYEVFRKEQKRLNLFQNAPCWGSPRRSPQDQESGFSYRQGLFRPRCWVQKTRCHDWHSGCKSTV